VPPFWLRAEENGVRIIDERVLAVAKDNWDWAFWLVKKQINDGSCTPEIVENVATDVTNRLKADPDVGRNLNGYFRTAVMRRVQTLVIRSSRTAYEGGTHDLETNHQPSAPDWTKVCEDRIVIKSLLPYMSHPVRRILNYRLLDYSGKQIAGRLCLTPQQAKKRFYYGVRQAHDELLADQAKRSRNEGYDQ
jgi:hypothetical protein